MPQEIATSAMLVAQATQGTGTQRQHHDGTTKQRSQTAIPISDPLQVQTQGGITTTKQQQIQIREQNQVQEQYWVPPCWRKMAVHLTCLTRSHLGLDVSVQSRPPQFLNTDECIWTHTTSKAAQIRCKVDKKRLMQHLVIFFNRSLLINGQRTTHQLQGQFDGQHTDRMTVSPAGGAQPISIETLKYRDGDSSCGVILVQSLAGGGTTHYDLRVKNSFIQGGPRQACQTKFSEFAPNGTVIYSSDCPNLLRPGK
ncbi:uncharacterized protein LOC125941082 [Dermacentor silvarum]|uniref:uncharacterized protein LOC125941082 n=1 Tax=Dermacentor silvarum TaxID=543639 RepID=UPI0021008FB6|nr:uncharacterized protein LOC125941082 [Dermacentor silvarum]